MNDAGLGVPRGRFLVEVMSNKVIKVICLILAGMMLLSSVLSLLLYLF